MGNILVHAPIELILFENPCIVADIITQDTECIEHCVDCSRFCCLVNYVMILIKSESHSRLTRELLTHGLSSVGLEGVDFYARYDHV